MDTHDTSKRLSSAIADDYGPTEEEFDKQSGDLPGDGED